MTIKVIFFAVPLPQSPCGISILFDGIISQPPNIHSDVPLHVARHPIKQRDEHPSLQCIEHELHKPVQLVLQVIEHPVLQDPVQLVVHAVWQPPLQLPVQLEHAVDFEDPEQDELHDEQLDDVEVPEQDVLQLLHPDEVAELEHDEQ